MEYQRPLLSIFNAAIDAVSGRQAVIRAMRYETSFKPDLIAAVGKAASDMCLGALDVFGPDIRAVVATKYQHSDPALVENPRVTVIESSHPIADENSLKAGRMLIDAVRSMSADSVLLLLVSGGASALAECLPDEMNLADWQSLNNEMIASGKSIARINEKRKSISLIKDGHLLENFPGKKVITCAISDVEGDSISTIGSGIGDINRTSASNKVLLVATNKMARDAAADEAARIGFKVKHNIETLYDDVFELSANLGTFIRRADKGVYIWGGEPTIALPINPGNGGRNQSLGLALAKEISGFGNIRILVAGTDGTDGPTDAAGAIIDGSTFRYPEEAQKALDAADAGDYLNKVGDRFVTGPTGTNVMDLVIAIIE
jgi:glycerate 2-kinase